MKPFMIVTALAMLATPAYASGSKIDKACVNTYRDSYGFTLAQANRACDPKTYVKPNELGWGCEGGIRNPIIKKDAPGGTRLKRDAICEQ